MKIIKLLLVAIIFIAAGCTYDTACFRHNAGNITYGLPSDEDFIIDRPGYALGFRDRDKQPAWVMYRLTSDQLTLREQLKIKRSNDFRPDPLIPTGSATPADYRNSGYDKGHMAPAADMGWSVRTMSDSFYMSNMSPQAPMCNRKIWADLENAVREFAKREGSVFVITGPIFGTNEIKKTIGVEHKVTVPAAYYKVIYAENTSKMFAFIIPNCGTTNSLDVFACTVDDVEDQTNLDFFKSMPLSLQEELESIDEHSYFLNTNVNLNGL